MIPGERQIRVPPRALAISLLALVVPVIVVLWLPDWTSNGLGMLIWLTALIPAFLFAYYRGLAGVAIALAGGMAVITATQVSVVVFDMAAPNWALLIAIVVVYLLVAVGIAVLAELLQRERRRAEGLAHEDRLTGLPNRRHAEMILAAEFAAAERGGKLSVVMFDLDAFKSVNDRFGHAAGDTALAAFAQVLRTNTRRENMSARYGGEEFVSVVRGATAENAVGFAQRVLGQMRKVDLPWGKQTVSAGVAEHEKGMGSFEFLLGAADRALYLAKEGGRDRVCVAPRASERRGTPVHSATMGVVAAPVRAAAPAADAIATGATMVSAAPASASHGLIWLVDDDDAVRNVIRKVLVRGGYDVWDTSNPLDVIARYRTEAPQARPALIVTDVIMPQMTGVRMVDEVVKMVPDIRVVYMSGYVQSDVAWDGSEGAAVGFVEKPVTSAKLLSAVESVLRSNVQLGAAGAAVAGPAASGPLPR